jgi:hypothetical protein
VNAPDVALTPTERRQSAAYRDAAQPAPPAACRNCAQYRYDAQDRMTDRGETFYRSNQRCGLHGFTVVMNKVCDSHAFRHADHRDA